MAHTNNSNEATINAEEGLDRDVGQPRQPSRTRVTKTNTGDGDWHDNAEAPPYYIGYTGFAPSNTDWDDSVGDTGKPWEREDEVGRMPTRAEGAWMMITATIIIILLAIGWGLVQYLLWNLEAKLQRQLLMGDLRPYEE